MNVTTVAFSNVYYIIMTLNIIHLVNDIRYDNKRSISETKRPGYVIITTEGEK